MGYWSVRVPGTSMRYGWTTGRDRRDYTPLPPGPNVAAKRAAEAARRKARREGDVDNATALHFQQRIHDQGATGTARGWLTFLAGFMFIAATVTMAFMTPWTWAVALPLLVLWIVLATTRARRVEVKAARLERMRVRVDQAR